MKKSWFAMAASAAVFLSGAAASAGTMTALPEAHFAGSGIPNDSVIVDAATHNGATITLGLTAHQRYSSPVVTNNGVDTFYAQPGLSVGQPDGAPEGATWNFAYFIDVDGTDYSEFDFEILIDADPAVGNSPTVSASLNFDSLAYFAASLGGGVSPDGNRMQDSQNLYFTWLGLPSFDPHVDGEYAFSLVAKTLEGVELARSNMTVVVGDPAAAVVPSPAAAGAGIALLGMVGALRLRRR